MPTVLPKFDPKTGKPIVGKAATGPSTKRKPGQQPTGGIVNQKPPTRTPGAVAGGASAIAPIVPRTSAPTTPPVPPAVMPGGGSSLVQNAAAGGTTGQGHYSTGNTGAVPGGVTDPLSGLAGTFTPGFLPTAMQQPEFILQALMQQMGQNPLGNQAGMFNAMTPYMDALMAISPVAWGGNTVPSNEQVVNWAGKLAQQGMTPGGAGINFGNVASSLAGIDPTSHVGAGLAGPELSPQDQINRAKSILMGAADQGVSPFFQSAISNYITRQALDWMGNYGQTGQMASPFYQTLKF